MKRRVLTAFLMLFFAFAFTACSSSNTGTTNGTTNGNTTGNQTPAVSIENYTFNPSVLTVNVGTTVIWTNNDSAVHNIKSADFNSPEMKKGETYKFKFDKAGTYDYSCGIHPTMTGKIIVVEKSTY
jgi:plastocyanin